MNKKIILLIILIIFQYIKGILTNCNDYKKMTNLEIYCVTDKPIKFLESTGYNLVAVGKNIFQKI